MCHQTFILRTLQLAQAAKSEGNHPFGALLVVDGSIVLESKNSVVTSGDVTQHAELSLIKAASTRFSEKTLSRAKLYTSTEPCAMCAAAIYWVGIREVIFGLSAKALGELTTGSLLIPADNIFDCGRYRTKLVGPILTKEAKKVHLGFWSKTK
ncbi:MAG: nucleoside deaminase [Pseudobacteriovorax sp.]|nr:nucleoside deaminase [Pseudobacteriovorax sp.]